MKTMFLTGLTLLLAAGCSAPKDENAPVNNLVAPPPEITAIEEDQDALAASDGANAASPVATWTGRWTGPEGLFLDIRPAPGGKPGRYALTLKDSLDAQGGYAGVARGDFIAFTRNGRPLTIRAGSGDETGFKYLAGKQDCLIVVAGKEGYCRD